uniref:Sugar transporter SWEET1 n=1 Tax=Zooxanthella nutricula TaxID=1333877 RepID=A0A6U9PWD4_9DINO
MAVVALLASLTAFKASLFAPQQASPAQLADMLSGRPAQPGTQRVLIVQIDDRGPGAAAAEGAAAFRKHSAAINEKYAHIHGYSYRYINVTEAPEGRHGAWAHVAIVRDLLAGGEYDYVMKLDGDATFATTDPLDALVDFGPLERGEKDIALAIDAMYYDLYECPRVHRLTDIERRCDAAGQRGEMITIQNASKCSSWFSADAWARGVHLGELRGVGSDELGEMWLESWRRGGVSALPAGATPHVFDAYGLAQRRRDLSEGGWWRDQTTTPAMAAFGAFNSGVYVAKASAASVALFDDWWRVPNEVCEGGDVAPRFASALGGLVSGAATEAACGAAGEKSDTRNAFTLRPNDLAHLSCADDSLRDYLSGGGVGGSPLYEQPALSLVLPAHMPRVDAYDAWRFNGPFSSLVWHPTGPAKMRRSIVHWFDDLLLKQQQQLDDTLGQDGQSRTRSSLFGYTWEVVPAIKDVIGWLAVFATLAFFAAPVKTVWGAGGIFRTGSTQHIASGFPHFVGFANCLCWVLYAAHDPSKLMQPLVINIIGLVFNASFMVCYWVFAPHKLACFVTLVAVSCPVAAAAQYAEFVGNASPLGQLAALMLVVMRSSPLVAAGEVVRTQSVEKFPLPPLLMTMVASGTWLAFGLYIGDASVTSANVVGATLGALQLALYFTYATVPRPPGAPPKVLLPLFHARSRWGTR